MFRIYNGVMDKGWPVMVRVLRVRFGYNLVPLFGPWGRSPNRVRFPIPRRYPWREPSIWRTCAAAVARGTRNSTFIGATKKRDILVCNFAFTRIVGGPSTFKIDGTWHSVLVDNFRINHPFLRAYFVNGRGQQIDSVLLGDGDWVWVTEEYGEGCNGHKFSPHRVRQSFQKQLRPNLTRQSVALICAPLRRAGW